MDSSELLPTKNGTPHEGKGGRNERMSSGAPQVSKSRGVEKDVTVATPLATLGRSSPPAKEAKWDTLVNSQGYRHCPSTRRFNGSSPQPHIFQDTT